MIEAIVERNELIVRIAAAQADRMMLDRNTGASRRSFSVAFHSHSDRSRLPSESNESDCERKTMCRLKSPEKLPAHIPSARRCPSWVCWVEF